MVSRFDFGNGGGYFVSPMNRVFYPLRGGVEVTTKFLTVHGVRYDVAGLSQLRIGALPHQQHRRILVRLLVADAVIALVIAGVAHSAIAVGAAIAYFAFAAVILRFAIHKWPPPLALVATYYGHRQMILVSRDHRAFHQICRALERAGERHQPSRGVEAHA